jgi:hypothetical protein
MDPPALRAGFDFFVTEWASTGLVGRLRGQAFHFLDMDIIVGDMDGHATTRTLLVAAMLITFFEQMLGVA